MNKQSTHSIILFDGVCNLCNGAVNFVIKRDTGNVFKFTPLQEKQGVLLLKMHAVDTQKLDSIVLIENEKVYVKSSAALRIARKLSGLGPCFLYFSSYLALLEMEFMILLPKTVTSGLAKKSSV